MSKFKTGDRVCLIEYPTCTGTIISLRNGGKIVLVRMDSSGVISYYPESLELIEESKVEPKFKAGDRIQLIAYPSSIGTVLKVSEDGVLARISMDDLGEYEYFTTVIQLLEDQSKEPEEYKYYKYSYKGIKLDPYRILDIYKITCPAQQHAIKKLLRAGNSVKELKQDITEVIDTLKRKLEMLEEEDSDNP